MGRLLKSNKPADKPTLRLVGGAGTSAGTKRGGKRVGAAIVAVAVAPSPAEFVESVRDRLVVSSRSEATRKAYDCDWRHFAKWCDDGGFDALPATPNTVALYLAAHIDRLKPATLQRRLVAIAQAHKDARLEPPTRADLVAKTLGGIRREVGVAQTQKTPLLTQDMQAVIAALPDTLMGKRDRALLLIGFSGAFRRGELVALNVVDGVPCADGLVITVRKSKTDQEGKGRKVGVPFGSTDATCPVRAYKAWMAAAGIKSGPVFRAVDKHGNVGKAQLAGWGAAFAIKRAVEAAGLDPSLFAGHSLRSGLVTSAAREGATEWEIMAQTGHKSPDMVKRYFREANLFKNNAAAKTKL